MLQMLNKMKSVYNEMEIFLYPITTSIIFVLNITFMTFLVKLNVIFYLLEKLILWI